MALVSDLVQDRIKLAHDRLFITRGLFEDVSQNSEYIEKNRALI
jgi:hypothetical protein